MRSVLSLFALVALISMEQITATTYYMSVSKGRDGNLGTSPIAPWRTFTSLWKIAPSLRPGDSVLFCQGETWMFSYIPATANTNPPASAPVNPITWGSYKCGTSTAQPVISPAVNILSQYWSVDPTNPNVLIFSLAQDVNALTSGIQALWVGTSRRYPARSPNLIDPTVGIIQSASEVYSNNGAQQTVATDNKIYSPSLNQAASNYWAGANVYMRTNNWSYQQARVIASGNGWIQVDKNPGSLVGFFMENNGNYSRSALLNPDAPGEWVFNRDDSSIHFWPTSSQERASLLSGAVEANFLYGNVPAAVTVTGTGHTIQDLAFKWSPGGIINQGAARSLLVQRNTIQNVAGFGLYTTRAPNTMVQNNVIDDADADCLVLDSTGGTAQYNTISRCGIHAGYGVKAGGGNQGIVSVNSVVQYNTLSDTGYSGIAPHYVANVIQNTISNVMLTLNDGGGVYTFGSAGNGLQIRNNVINNVVGNYASWYQWNITSCVFTDQGSSSMYIFNNTCSRAPQCMQLNSAFDMVILSNRCNVPGIYINGQFGGGGHVIAGNQVTTSGTTSALQNPIARVYQPGATSMAPVSAYYNNLYCQSQPTTNYLFQWDFGVNGWARYNDYAGWVHSQCQNSTNCAFESGSGYYFYNCDSYSPYFWPVNNNAGPQSPESTITVEDKQSAVSPAAIAVPVVAGCVVVVALVALVIFRLKNQASSELDQANTALPAAHSFGGRDLSASLDYEQFCTPSPVVCISHESGSSVELSPQYDLYKSRSAPLPLH